MEMKEKKEHKEQEEQKETTHFKMQLVLWYLLTKSYHEEKRE